MKLLFRRPFQQFSFQSVLIWMMILCVFGCYSFSKTSLHAVRGVSKQSLIGEFAFDRFSFLRTQQKPKHFIVLNSVCGMGFFGDFLTALGALHLYNAGIFSGVSIEYGTDGTYYDPEIGPNWWEYYFEPVHVGYQGDSFTHYSALSVVVDDRSYDLPRMTEFNICRKDAHRLIEQFVKLKPHIVDKVNQIVEDVFGDSSMIGVHYRGTDKWTESPIAPYDKVVAHVDEFIAQLQEIGHPEIKIFVATDEQNFLDYMRERYPTKVVCYEECARSSTGEAVHTSGIATPYKKGEDALIDCLLLSKTDVILKTSSNLSLCSSYFNPDIPMVHITSREWRAPLE